MTKENKKPIIAIVGRTNVGKSMLFNTLAEKNKALVSAIPGTTRDRAFSDAVWRGQLFRIIDTGGFERNKKTKIDRGIKDQIQLAIKQADLIYFVVDVRDGVLPEDVEVSRRLHKINKPIILIANKADKKNLFAEVENKEWKKLTFGTPVPISATTGLGVGDLLDITYDELEKIKIKPQQITEIDGLKIGIFGKPNVGKSSLVNALLGEPRMIVSDVAFTTREPQDTFLKYKGKNYIIVDTAGLRKRAKIKEALEKKGTRRTQDVLEEIDIALYVVDISEPISGQDKKIASMIAESGKGIVTIANKWDKIKDKTTHSAKEYTDYIHYKFPFLFWSPILFTSATDRKNVNKIFELILAAEKEREREITPNALNKFLKLAIKKARPIGGPGMVTPPYIHTMEQTGTKPPTFAIDVKSKHVIHPNYLKYLEKQLRKKFGFEGTPVIIKSRSRK